MNIFFQRFGSTFSYTGAMVELGLGKRYVKNVVSKKKIIENPAQTICLTVIFGIVLVYVHIW